MEDSRTRSEEDGNQEGALTPRKRRGGDFLSQYLLRRKEKLDGEQEQDDTEEDSDEKPKKFRRFFRGLFRNVVQPPEKSAESLKNKSALESLFFAWDDSEKLVNQTPETKAAFEPNSLPESMAGEQTTPLTDISHTYEAGPFANHSDKAISGAEYSADEMPETNPSYDIANPPEVPPPLILPPEMREQRVPPKEMAASRDATLFERAVPTPTEREVIIERGPGMVLPVALVGAEYLARKKADRKLDKKFTEKVTAQEKNNKRTEMMNHELQELTKQNHENLAKLKTDRGLGPTERPNPIPLPERMPQARPEAPVAAGHEVAPSKQEIEELKPHAPEHQDILSRPEQAKPETFKLMEQVAEAAEKGVAVERVFERSHEVKDDTNVSSSAASIGAIMAAQAEERHRTDRLQAMQRQMGGPDENLPVLPNHQQPEMYRQAMQRGFWAAMIIIIFGTLAFLLK